MEDITDSVILGEIKSADFFDEVSIEHICAVETHFHLKHLADSMCRTEEENTKIIEDAENEEYEEYIKSSANISQLDELIARRTKFIEEYDAEENELLNDPSKVISVASLKRILDNPEMLNALQMLEPKDRTPDNIRDLFKKFGIII